MPPQTWGGVLLGRGLGLRTACREGWQKEGGEGERRTNCRKPTSLPQVCPQAKAYGQFLMENCRFAIVCTG